jgi:hypothetical protein
MMTKYILPTKTFLIILYKMDVHLKDRISFFKTHKLRLGPYDYEGSEMKHKIYYKYHYGQALCGKIT